MWVGEQVDLKTDTPPGGGDRWSAEQGLVFLLSASPLFSVSQQLPDFPSCTEPTLSGQHVLARGLEGIGSPAGVPRKEEALSALSSTVSAPRIYQGTRGGALPSLPPSGREVSRCSF